MCIRSSKTGIRSVMENNWIRKQNCGLFEGIKTLFGRTDRGKGTKWVVVWMRIFFRYLSAFPNISGSQIYRMAHEKPARRLVEQRGRRSRTLYRKLNKCKCKVLTGYRRCWKWSPCTSLHFCASYSILSYTRCKLAVSIRRIDTAELHDNMLQRAQKCVDVQGDHFQHLL